ncbi:DUF3606 domain-containing protein [Bacillus sp. NP157]|nr:DUF3606 domain-containing protein [Bacillus sp. NP157]
MQDDDLPRKTHIDAADPQDVALWALVLDVTPSTILAAVAEVGPEASAVQSHLKG